MHPPPPRAAPADYPPAAAYLRHPPASAERYRYHELTCGVEIHHPADARLVFATARSALPSRRPDSGSLPHTPALPIVAPATPVRLHAISHRQTARPLQLCPSRVYTLASGSALRS